MFVRVAFTHRACPGIAAADLKFERRHKLFKQKNQAVTTAMLSLDINTTFLWREIYD
jgi:hypothetical protein